MRVTSKGQVTVPKVLRDRFGITQDTEIEFREVRGQLVLVKAPRRSPVERLRGKLQRLPIGRTVDEYVAALRGR